MEGRGKGQGSELIRFFSLNLGHGADHKAFYYYCKMGFCRKCTWKKKKNGVRESVHLQLPQRCVAVAAQVPDAEVVHHHQDEVGPAALLRRRRDVLQRQEGQQNETQRPYGLHREEITAGAVGLDKHSRMSKVRVIRTRSAYITTHLLHMLCILHLHILYTPTYTYHFLVFFCIISFYT